LTRALRRARPGSFFHRAGFSDSDIEQPSIDICHDRRGRFPDHPQFSPPDRAQHRPCHRQALPIKPQVREGPLALKTRRLPLSSASHLSCHVTRPVSISVVHPLSILNICSSHIYLFQITGEIGGMPD
jgi:hypothetical protein